MVSLAGSGQTSLGVEIVETNALVQIYENLELQLQRQAQFWDPIDRRLADKLDQPYKPTKLEFPPHSSYYPGSRIGILGLPWDSFPAVAVMADRFDPAPASETIDGYGIKAVISVFIEAVVRSDAFASGDPDPSPAERTERVYQEGLVNRRAKRTLEALVQCVAIDRTFGGVVPSFQSISGGQTDAFTLPGAEPDNMALKRVFTLVRVNCTPESLSLWPESSPVLPGGFGS